MGRWGKIWVIVCVLGMGGWRGWAQDSNMSVPSTDESAGESKTKVEPEGGANSVPGSEEVDEMITNNNLRAYSGSLSRWSIASQFNYNGGTVVSPLSENRPNISDDSATTVKSDLDGAISVKYNLDVVNSLMAGIGIRWIAPLSPGGPKNYDGTLFDVENPYIQYQYIYKMFGKVQAVLQIQDLQWTQADFTAVGYMNQPSFDQEYIYEVPDTHLSVGCSLNGQYVWFNKSGSYGSPNSANYIQDISTVQSVYQLDFEPYAEYQLSERWNLRTLVDLLDYEHYANVANKFTFVHDKVFQEIGVGYKVTRDIFLYPNMQFLPDNLRSQLTNVGVTATINVF